jgi:CheY-like chemotaxis protein
MSRILVWTAEPSAAEVLQGILAKADHALSFVDSGREMGVLELVETIVSAAPELAVMDYLPTDSFSVKVMQQCRGRGDFIKFIFLVRLEVGLDHLVLAVNEGAGALLTIPIREEALLNYVNRALTQRKAEKAQEEQLARCEQLMAKERNGAAEQSAELSQLKRSQSLNHRLINHLLATTTARKKPKVLLVSDSTYQLDLFRKHLEDLNFQVATAADGAQGLEKARQEHPRIIVSDLEMPGLNGIELCLAVKNDETMGPNHFIICTANEGRIREVLKPENKVDDCLVKPGKGDEFQAFTARVALGLLD